MNKSAEKDTLIGDLIISVKSLIHEFRANLKFFILIGPIVFAYFIYTKINTPIQYIAKTSFMLNETGGQSSGLSSILGQFGIQTPGDGISLQKIIEITKTRILAERIFLSKETINGKEDYLANHYINSLKQYNQWKSFWSIGKSDPLDNFSFTHSDVKKFSILENSALKKIHSIFLSQLVTTFNERTGIMELITTFPDHELSYVLGNKLFNELSQFYIDKSIEKQQDTYDKIKNKVDSLRNLMHRKDYSLAQMKDGFRNTWTFEDVVPQNQTDRDVRMLNVIYAEALKNYEFASFNLQTQTPLIQALDLPIKPLDSKKVSWLSSIFKSLLFTFLIGAIIIILRKLIKENS